MAKDKEMLLVATKVKDYVKSEDMMISADMVEAVNECVYECLDRAIERAKANGRKTVQPRDV